MVTILISGVEFYGYHGVSEAERSVGHRFSVDVELDADVRATDTDALDDTVDYGAVAGEIVAVGEGRSCQTVERLTMLMAERLLAKHLLAKSVTIEVRKLLPPVAVAMNDAGVRLTLKR